MSAHEEHGSNPVLNPERISIRALKEKNLLPQKEKAGKTMFKLPPEAANAISILCDLAKVNTLKVLDTIATCAQAAYEQGDLKFVDLPENSVRKSFSISSKAKDIFMKMAGEEKLSRDQVVYSAIQNFCSQVAAKALPTSEKIRQAKIMLDAVERMLEIWCEDSVNEAARLLEESEDPDYHDPDDMDSCGENIMYVGRLHDQAAALREFIERKEAELEREKKAAKEGRQS